MPEEIELSEDLLDENKGYEKVIVTSFLIIDNDEGFQIKMSNNTEMHVSETLPNSVSGIIRIDNQTVPIIDPGAKKGGKQQEVTSDSCVILQQHQDGKHSVITGSIYDDVSAVLEIIKQRI